MLVYSKHMGSGRWLNVYHFPQDDEPEAPSLGLDRPGLAGETVPITSATLFEVAHALEAYEQDGPPGPRVYR